LTFTVIMVLKRRQLTQQCAREYAAKMRLRIDPSSAEYIPSQDDGMMALYFFTPSCLAEQSFPFGQFPRKTGAMSGMPSALNDKRGAPRVSGTVNGIKPLTEEDNFNNSQSLLKKPYSLYRFFYPLSSFTRFTRKIHSPRQGKAFIFFAAEVQAFAKFTL